MACSRESSMLNTTLVEASYARHENSSTRSLDVKDCVVTLDDIDAYVRFKKLLSKETEVMDISLYPNEANPTLYIVNYNDGWEIISGDKRTSAVIASGEGRFSTNDINSNCLEWIKHLSSEIALLKITKEETRNALEYMMFWKCINPDNYFIQEISTTRSGLDTSYHPVPGHYELIYVDENINVIDSIGHLIKTKWGQTYPYNQYCPIDSSHVPYDSPERCYVGCVPLAGGQIVNYYHLNDCCPAIYDSAYVNTREFPYTNWDLMRQWHKSPANWAKMHSTDSSRMAAILLANIGQGIEAKYDYYDGGTNASLTALHDFLLEEYELESYDILFTSPYINCYDYIEELLMEGFPSIIGGAGTQINNIDVYRHAFIVDRYKKQRVDYCYTYGFCPNDGYDYPFGDEVQYIYHSPASVYFGMNWGFFGQGDDTWCVKSGDWYCGSVNFSNRIQLLSFKCDGEEPGPEGNR